MPTTLELVSSRKPAAKDREAYDRMQKDLTFLSESRDRLIKKHAEQWVAIHNQELIAHASNVHELLSKVSRQNIPIGEVVIDFLTDKKRALVL